MKPKYEYKSFSDKGAQSELEAIRAKIVKQEVTKIIREQERQRIQEMLQEPAKPLEIPQWLKDAAPGIFKFFFWAGLVTIAYVLANLLV